MADTIIELEARPGTTTVYATSAGGSGTAAASYAATAVAGYVFKITVAEALTGAWYFGAGNVAGDDGYRKVDNLTDEAKTFSVATPHTAEIATSVADQSDIAALISAWVDGGRLDLILDAVKAKTDLITTATVSVRSGVAADGQTVTITQGDSYAGDDIEFTGSSADQWPDLTGATLEFRATMSGAPPVTATPIVTSATGTQKFTLPLSTTDTATPVGRYRYDVQATWDETPVRVKTLVKNGPFVVERTHTDEP